jgi:hypothetical protein
LGNNKIINRNKNLKTIPVMGTVVRSGPNRRRSAVTKLKINFSAVKKIKIQL